LPPTHCAIDKDSSLGFLGPEEITSLVEPKSDIVLSSVFVTVLSTKSIIRNIRSPFAILAGLRYWLIPELPVVQKVVLQDCLRSLPLHFCANPDFLSSRQVKTSSGVRLRDFSFILAAFSVVVTDPESFGADKSTRMDNRFSASAICCFSFSTRFFLRQHFLCQHQFLDFGSKLGLLVNG